MSIDFNALCTRPLPPDWAPDFQAEGFPFDFALGDAAAWKAETGAWTRESGTAGELEAALAAKLDSPASFVAVFNCRPAVAELVDLCAQALVSRFGGFYYDDTSGEVSQDFEGGEGATGAQVLAAWRKLVEDGDARERAVSNQARREYEEARAAEPESFAEADDWSDLQRLVRAHGGEA